MSPTVRTISQRLSLRPPQKDSLEILDQVFTSLGLPRNKPKYVFKGHSGVCTDTPWLCCPATGHSRCVSRRVPL